MTTFYENATVVYTAPDGREIDTFVVFATNEQTGLTHINHENLQVTADTLMLHDKTICQYHMPLNDAFSFEMLSKLKAKYAKLDAASKTVQLNNATTRTLTVLANAS